MFRLLGLALLLVACSRPPLEPLRTASMYPTLGPRSQCRVDREAFAPERGHVVLVEIDGQTVVRRVVGVPGDVVAVQDGVVHLNGEAVESEVLRERTGCRVSVSARCACQITEEVHGSRTATVQQLVRDGTSRDFRCAPGRVPPEVIVPEGHVYVLADNRDAARDSRHVGPVRTILGRVVSCR